jgi:TRAP-type C4-dicarboxylate transport system permease small subunit
MRRTGPVIVLAIFVTSLFLAGLAWMTRLRERAWSQNPSIRAEQVRFVIAVATTVTVVYVLNRFVNRRRRSGALRNDEAAVPPRTESDLMRDRWLDS